MKYAEMESIEAGLKFKSAGGLKVQTTGNTTYIEAHEMHVHEVEVLEGVGQGQKFLHNLDYATPLDE